VKVIKQINTISECPNDICHESFFQEHKLPRIHYHQGRKFDYIVHYSKTLKLISQTNDKVMQKTCLTSDIKAV